MKKLVIKKELIGAQVYHAILNRYFEIKEGEEKLYNDLGMDVFDTPQVPKLQKNAKDKKKRHDRVDDNSNGVDDNIES